VTIKGGATGNGMFNPPFVVEFDYQPTSLSETLRPAASSPS
jgi:hypothetical protein